MNKLFTSKKKAPKMYAIVNFTGEIYGLYTTHKLAKKNLTDCFIDKDDLNNSGLSICRVVYNYELEF